MIQWIVMNAPLSFQSALELIRDSQHLSKAIFFDDTTIWKTTFAYYCKCPDVP